MNILFFSRFNYTREDEEIYKEFLEIANELIPNIVKSVSMEPIMSYKSQMNILYCPDVYANILRFYDGICEWEEGSSTPVLHVGWAQHLTFSLNKFDPRARAKVDVGRDEDDDEEDSDEEVDGKDNDSKSEKGDTIKEAVDGKAEEKEKRAEGPSKMEIVDSKFCDPLKIVVDDMKNDIDSMLTPPSGPLSGGHRVTARGRKGQRRKGLHGSRIQHFGKDAGGDVTSGSVTVKNSYGDEQEDKIKSTIEELASKVQSQQDNDSSVPSPNPNITALAQQCSLNILNKDYLLGAGEPFSSSPATITESPSPATVVSTSTSAAGGSESRLDMDEFLSSKSNGTAFIGLTMDSMLKAESPADMMLAMKRSDNATRAAPAPSPSPSPTTDLMAATRPVQIELKSEKMRVMKKMFRSAKLNASAIKLQLTAQSQVHVKDSRFLDICEPSGSVRKRPRREII